MPSSLTELYEGVASGGRIDSRESSTNRSYTVVEDEREGRKVWRAGILIKAGLRVLITVTVLLTSLLLYPHQ